MTFGTQPATRHGPARDGDLNMHAGNREHRIVAVTKSEAGRAENAPAAEGTRDLQSLLDAVGGHIAVLDRSGTVVTVNASWRAFSAEVGWGDHGVGLPCAAACEGVM